MAEYIVKTDKNGIQHIKVKFHQGVKRFKRVENFKYKGIFFKVYIDKNNNVYNLERSDVSTWKEIEKGKRKIKVPDGFKVTPQPEIMNTIRGNSYETAIQRIMTILDREDFS